MLEAKRGLLLAISHELRSPLTRARLNTELLPEETATAAMRQALLRDLALMRDLVTDLLESERLATRHAALQLETVDLGALTRDVLASLEPAEAAATVVLTLDPDLPAVRLDPARMRLLLRNLLDNALRHSVGAALPPELQVVLVTDTAGAKHLRISVRDHGPGVDEAALPQLAEPFYRPDSARQRSTGGVGLGLHLCKLVALAHGGRLVLTNAQPGLRASVELPLA
jgi:signal transduction histidine kinase